MAEVQLQSESEGIFSNLKERRFFPFLFSYILGGFTIIQLVEWVTKRYAYSPYWTDAIFLFLLLILPAVVLFIYHHGKPGPDNWMPVEKWFIPLNLLIAIAAVWFGLGGKDFGSTVQEVKVVDEDGVESVREVPKAAYSQKVVIMPSVIEGDDVDWLRSGFGILLSHDLEQDNAIYTNTPLALREKTLDMGLGFDEDLSFKQKLETARKNYASYFLDSKITKTAQGYKVFVEAFTTSDGKEFFSEEIEASSIYEIVDQVSSRFKELLISDHSIMAKEDVVDLPASELITSNEDALKAYFRSINMAAYDRDFQGSISFAEKAKEIDGQSPMILDQLSKLYMSANMAEKKAEVSEQALDLIDGLPERQALEIKKSYYLPAEFSKIFDLLEYQIKLYPNDYNNYEELIGYRKLFGANLLAIDVAERAVAAGHRGKNLLTLSELYNSQGDSEKALKYFDEFSEEFPERAKELNQKSSLLIGAGRFQEALDYLEEKSIGDPNNRSILFSKADAFKKLLKFSEAEKSLKKTLRLGNTVSDSIASYAQLMIFYSGQGRFSEAVEASKTVKNLNLKFIPEMAAELQQINWQNMMLYINAGRTEELETMLDRIKSTYEGGMLDLPCFVDINYSIAREDYAETERLYQSCEEALIASDGQRIVPLIKCFVAQGNKQYDEAIKHITEFATTSGLPDFMIDYSKMNIYNKAEKYEEVIKLRSEVSDIKLLELADYHFQLAKAYKGLDKKDEANEQLDFCSKILANADDSYWQALEVKEMIAELQ